MNVIISNRYSEMLSNLNIDVIKNVRGEYDAEVIVSNFQNFFFNKMILDITAVKDYRNIANIQKLSFGLDMSKVILLLDDSREVNSPMYLSSLVSMGIYNFTKNIEKRQKKKYHYMALKEYYAESYTDYRICSINPYLTITGWQV